LVKKLLWPWNTVGRCLFQVYFLWSSKLKKKFRVHFFQEAPVLWTKKQCTDLEKLVWIYTFIVLFMAFFILKTNYTSYDTKSFPLNWPVGINSQSFTCLFMLRPTPNCDYPSGKGVRRPTPKNKSNFTVF